MCRHLAHVGPVPVTLASLVTEPQHSLLVQSYAPSDMRGGGTVNADGFGVGWRHVSDLRGYSRANHSHGVYRRDDPIWTDESFLGLAHEIASTAIVAAVRSATVGMGVSAAACAPFSDEQYLFSHNGVVRGWPESMAGLAGTLDPLELLRMDAATDSALLWALLRARLRAGQDPAEATARVVIDTLAAAPGSRLNLLLCDGEQIVATAVDHALSVHEADDGAVTVASEPLDDDPSWRPVPDHSLLIARAGAVSVRPLASLTSPTDLTSTTEDVTATP